DIFAFLFVQRGSDEMSLPENIHFRNWRNCLRMFYKEFLQELIQEISRKRNTSSESQEHLVSIKIFLQMYRICTVWQCIHDGNKGKVTFGLLEQIYGESHGQSVAV